MTEMTSLAQPHDRDLAPVAALFGDSTRVKMLTVLADGHALPAGELARSAGVHPATATAHLRRLVEGGLVRVRVQGRHRYHELAGEHVAAVLEALAQVAPPAPVRSLRQHRDVAALTEARTCYDHLAGRRGVELRDRLLAAGALRPINDRDHVMTAQGMRLIAELGIDPDRITATRRVFARSCVDWTHRRPHLAGALPAAITGQLLARGWLSRNTGRGLRVAPDYDQQLGQWLSSQPEAIETEHP
ncbi:helix-turn-helix transcriptional regulator [Nonomuraea sp. NPDC049152]|uniref:ArsR/SmtB family transcription factor n=1 Tax=Nonomuraea sp. NPDC049152 TaxID=3154350 RepID=UPI0033DEEB5C